MLHSRDGVAERPWLGFGLGGFWVADSESVALVWDAIGWNPPPAHEGWLDLLLERAIVGPVLLPPQILRIAVRSTRAVVEGRAPDSQYLIVMNFMLLSYNVSESNPARPGIMWGPADHRRDGRRQDRDGAQAGGGETAYGGFQRPVPLSPSAP